MKNIQQEGWQKHFDFPFSYKILYTNWHFTPVIEVLILYSWILVLCYHL